MITVVHIETGKQIDVQGKITYFKRIADIGDVTKVSTSYSWSMNVPRTPRNVAFMKGLGLVGNDSDVPYTQQKVNVLDRGAMIIEEGLMRVQATEGDRYKVHFQEGVIDWYEGIKGDKISGVIDLSDLDHQNTVSNITASFTQDTYRYIIANYNGPPLADQPGGTTDLNPFALVPSINIEYLWDKIFEYYGWSYSGNFDFSDTWMTYPQAISYDAGSSIRAADFHQTTDIFPDMPPDPLPLTFESKVVDATFAEVVGETVRVKETGAYRITTFVRGRMRHFIFGYKEFFIQLFINGDLIFSQETDNTAQEGGYELDRVLQEGDIVELKAKAKFPNPVELFYYEGRLILDTLGIGDISFSSALIKFKVKDFFKELLVREGMTPVPDVRTKSMHFVTMDERLNADIVDWSSKYLERIGERYVYKSYHQQNNFKHKYDQENDDHHDGKLVINNQNVPTEKDLYKSPTFAPLEELVEYKDANTSYFVNNFKMFDIETKEDPDTGDVLADYKALKDRFYIFNSENSTRTIYILGQQVNGFPVPTLNGNTLADVVQNKYVSIEEVLNNTKIHRIKLKMSQGELLALDLVKRYYFKQEQAIYLLNSIKWVSGEDAVGEFIKLN